MASPVTDTYTGVSGATIYGGRFLPGAPGALSTTFSLTSASSATAPFSLGHAFKRGDVTAGQGITVTGATAQVVPKNYWPDGSLKFAIVSGSTSLVAATPKVITLTIGTASSGTALTTANLKTAMSGQTCSIACGAFGTVSWATTDFDTPFKTWVSGAQMSSWIYRKPVGSDTHLVGWLEVRLFASGEVEVLPWIENGYLMVASPTNKSATYAFTLGGTQRFSQAIDLPNHCRTVLIGSSSTAGGAETSYWLGTARDVIPKHDVDYLQSTDIVPAYSASVDAAASVISGIVSTYTPLQQGGFPATMGSVGSHESIGLLPEWDVLYLASTAPAAYKGVVFNGYSAGRYAMHFRDETETGDLYRPIRFSSHANLTVSDSGPTGLGSVAPVGSPTPAPTGTTPPLWETAHHPAVGIVPYLVTGRHYFMEQAQFATCAQYLTTSAVFRDGANCVLKVRSGSSSIQAERAVGWQLRTLAQAACVTPDSDPLRTEYMNSLKANWDYDHTLYIVGPNNTLGFWQAKADYNSGNLINGVVSATPTPTSTTFTLTGIKGTDYTVGNNQLVGWTAGVVGGGTGTVTASVSGVGTQAITLSAPITVPTAGQQVLLDDGKYFGSTWMQDFVTASIGYIKALDLGFDATTKGKLNALWSWKAKSVVGRLGGAGSTEFNYRAAAAYTIAIAPSDAPDFDGGTGPWYSDWGSVYAATYAGTTTDPAGFAPYASPGTKSENGALYGNLAWDFQWANMLPALAYAVKFAEPGAERAYQRLTTASNYPTLAANLDARPVWAVAPFALPAWRRGQAVGEWREISGSDMLTNAPNVVIAKTLTGGTAVGSGNGYSSRLDAYCGATLDTRRSTLWTVAAGGHGDYYNNEMVYQNLMADAPKWAIYFNGSSGNVIDYASSNVPAPDSRTRYADGLPAARHTYSGSQFLERHNRAFATGGSISPLGTAYQDCDGFNVDVGVGNNGWSAVYAYPGSQGGVGSSNQIGGNAVIAAACCKDPTTEVVYTFSSNRLHKITPSVGGPTGTAGSGGTYSYSALSWNGAYPFSEGASAVDTTRGKIFWTHGYGPNPSTNPYTFDIAGDALDATHTYSGTDATALASVPASCGVIYVPRLDKYLLRGPDAGAQVFTIDPSTFVVGSVSSTGGSGIPTQAGSGGPGQTGVYNKWQFVPHLRGAVYLPGAAFNTWFLRLY